MSERFFASDNSAPVHPQIMSALQAANDGHAISYGDDPWTREAVAALRRVLGRKASVHFVYNGTGSNVLGMQAALSGYHAIVCTDVSHINTDECGAPERNTGAKLLPVTSTNGRMRPDQIESHLHALGVEHHSQPKVVSLTQSTELGTVYRPDEVKEIARICHRHGLLVHMDGARISNAAAFLDGELPDVTAKLGVDILSLGGTKNGMMFGEAVVFFRPELSDAFPYIRKQGMQLASKMRYIAAQFAALYGGDLWRELATHANAMAAMLARKLAPIPEIEIAYPVEANAVFARVPRRIIKRVQDELYFYVWDEEASIVRFMCSYDTTESDVEKLVAAVNDSLD
ncbi:MAG: threonine aldolase family protein [Spirochaetota bacterium]